MTELLGACGGEIEVIGVSRSVADARLFLSWRRPDVVFLDFSMPAGPGVELLPDVGPETQVVFVTVTEVAAVAAFEHGVVDYLLKRTSQPVTVRRNIGEWEAMLPAATLQRLDRSLIVNLQRLSTTQTRSREQTLLSFEGVDAPLPIGRTAAARLKEALRV